jgi:hypothetical protein
MGKISWLGFDKAGGSKADLFALIVLNIQSKVCIRWNKACCVYHISDLT